MTDRRSTPVRLRARTSPAPPRPGHGPAAPSGACWAPHGSMYFDQFGRARACCQNTEHVMGDVARQTIAEIWESAASEELREALDQGSYEAGCGFCGWQAAEGNDDILFARQYDFLQPEGTRRRWPKMMEFALTNACNLQCEMCDGDFSSAIRARREGRPALPAAYGDAFFEELAEFLPHLTDVKFAGGEPFLGAEPLRVLDLLTELAQPPQVSIITNGTILTPRVERILTALRPRLIVSIDGATPETYDAIRVGAHLPTVLGHLDRMCELVGPDHVSITTCLMTSNWHEFAAVLELAEDRGLDVGVNVVGLPVELSLYRLDPDELTTVVASMRAVPHRLTGPRLQAWEGNIAALEHRIEAQRTGGDDAMFPLPPEELEPAPTSRWGWLPYPELATPSDGARVPPADVPSVTCFVGTDGVVAVTRQDLGAPVDLGDLDGGPVDALYPRLAEHFGDPGSWTFDERRRPRDDDRFWLWLGPGPDGVPSELVGTSVRNQLGHLTGTSLVVRAATREIGSPWPEPGAP